MLSRGNGIKLGAVSVLALSISACSVFQTETVDTLKPIQDKTYKLTVLHTNDHHGRFWQDRKGRWGMAARMTLVNKIRKEVEAEGGNVLLLSGGDINTGVPESDLQDAVPDFMGMNKLGYDAMAVGNHEFDNTRDILMMQKDLANFPFLSANIIDEKTGKALFTPYKMFEFNGLEVAVMGLTTTDTPKQSSPENVKGLDFVSPVEVASELVPELRKTADIVVAATHMGHYANANYGVNAPGDVTLARSVDGIDMVVGGHSQDALKEPDQQNGAYIVQAQEWGKYVGRADFEFKNGDLKLVDYELIPVNPKNAKVKIAQDPEMLALLQPYQDKGSELVQGTVGSVDERLMGERGEVRFQPTNLGTLIGAAFMEKTGADFATMNGGGIRASVDGGEITYKDVLTVLPFGNTVTTVEMNGKEVMDYLTVVATKPTNSGAFAHFTGIDMVIDGDKVSDVKIAGEAIDMNKTYKMAILSFSAGGGDKYPNVSKMSGYVDTGFTDAEVFREFVEKHSPLKVAEYEPKGVVRK
ncbi:bifunctional UDP-sugar hydrolase/5'-nucleotidase UshA [Sansalvadorimonas sp. 2012CJ34-2]|uniref:Bifunctional UDP-sugar hydrolase/5'-nucleotidase UshA n=2 Tax=Parendozoicomonas callyspongiae TaxID=2942213 RepID=A0ABT0PJP1_9GAMM|nr:bifunctional UDP-sugar hydrolase/5'-nucleotidase UshA [Sansalvadorimonas sp. 2012CJ34-2]MCL6271590.1 bifunctional UDP-sugar hydrolase/5'-nucleotidase UshA [Sansalvadorimonas sp. 2012CJ34-2]